MNPRDLEVNNTQANYVYDVWSMDTTICAYRFMNGNARVVVYVCMYVWLANVSCDPHDPNDPQNHQH